MHTFHLKCCDSSRVVLLKPVGFPAVCTAKALGWRFWGMCYKQHQFTAGCDTRFFHRFPRDIESVHYLWPQRSCALNRRSPFQSGVCTIPDYYWCVCLGLLQQQAAGLLFHTSGASVSWALFLFPCPLLLLWNAPFLTKEPAGGLCLNEPAASGNRGFSSLGQCVEAVGGRCQLVALPLPLCVWECYGCSSWQCSQGEEGGMR